MTDKEKYDALTTRIVKEAVEAHRASRAALGKNHEVFTENSRVYDILFDIIRESGDGDFWEKFYAADRASDERGKVT